MTTLQHIDRHLAQVSLFPVEERDALTAFIGCFPEALDLALTNPPLAVALANARRWDTFGLAIDHAFIGGLLRQRRRRICGALGFPASERAVRILGKVQPQACTVNLIARVRSAMRDPAVVSILAHLQTIGPGELWTATNLENCSQISPTLFGDVADHFGRENDRNWGTLLRQIHILSGAHQQGCRALRSVQQVRRCYHRLWRGLVEMQGFDSTHDKTAVTNISFPPAPLAGIDEIKPIDSAPALVEEARAMGHCVLSYAERVAEGDTYLYRVLNPERATLLINYRGSRWHLEELAGVRNQPVSSQTEEAVERWLHCARPCHSRIESGSVNSGQWTNQART